MKKHLNVTIEETLVKVIKEYCHEQNISVSSLIEKLMQNFIENIVEKKPITREDIEEVLEKYEKNNGKAVKGYVTTAVKELIKQGYLLKETGVKQIEEKK